MTLNQVKFTQKVLKIMKEKLAHHQMLFKYTKHSVKLKKHLTNIRLWEEIIVDYKDEYNIK